MCLDWALNHAGAGGDAPLSQAVASEASRQRLPQKSRAEQFGAADSTPSDQPHVRRRTRMEEPGLGGVASSPCGCG